MPGTSPWETTLVGRINDYFKDTQQPGIAFRLKQSHFYTQYVDVLVDHGSRAFYLAIECKSIDPKKTKKFYFSSWTVDKKGVHQIDRISEFLEKGQRFGILAAEIRRGQGHTNEVYLAPWHHVKYAYDNGVKGFSPKDLAEKYPRLLKDEGVLNLEYCLHCLRQF